MENRHHKVFVAQMEPRKRGEWTPPKRRVNHHRRKMPKRLLRYTAIFAAVSLCLGTGTWLAMGKPDNVQAVMSHLTAGFEYDETLGRLQFVSNILPKSAMVFLTNGGEEMRAMAAPSDAQVMHAWSQEEPWLEYACIGDVSACQDGEVMTIVKNRQDEYTVRVLHADGYESVYSGLCAVRLAENDRVGAGEQIGTAAGFAAFELRKDGLSVLPVFGAN